MKQKDKKEIAKDLLMESLAVAYYKLENSEYSHLSEEEQEEICKYIHQYGTAMGKRINRNFYTM